MPLPRFRLRTLMIAVAVVAVVAGPPQRRQRFQRVALSHELAGALATPTAVKTASRLIDEGKFTEADSASMRAPWPGRGASPKAMGGKYRRAARVPWLSVPPDPPPPE